MAKQHNFKIIKGGNSRNFSDSFASRRFVSAYVTDTRLMGVVALSIHWKIPNSGLWDDLHQFFYFDAEEYGLDTYQSFQGSDPHTLDSIEQGLIGGLGGKKVPITEREAVYLLQHFAAESHKLGVILPEPGSEYIQLIKEPVLLSLKETAVIINKICTPILSDYQLIHYFLMRCFAKDWLGASYLIDVDSDSNIELDNLSGKNPATLCKNTIEEYFHESGAVSYLCEAAIDMDGKYELIVLEITVKDNKVSSALRRSSFRISAAEASMMLNRAEFITVYEIMSTPEEFDDIFLPMNAATLQTNHDNGRLFMEFNKNNDHVNQKVFRLNEDVRGLYYVSDYGQLIIAAYSLKEIHSIEISLQRSSIYSFLLPSAKYEFKEPVLYDFIQSDFEDFEDFLMSLQ